MFQSKEKIIIVFEPQKYIFSFIRQYISEEYIVISVHNKEDFEAVVKKEDTNINCIIALDEIEQYDTLEILEKYKNMEWFACSLTMLVTTKLDLNRKEKADMIGIQDYLDLSNMKEEDYERAMKYCMHRNMKVANRIRHLNALANSDGLTGFYNHAAAPSVVTKMLMKYPNQEFLFAIIDIDYFKQVNDQRGHEFGDKVLKEEANRLNEILGEQAVAIRYGGDEFVVMVPIVFDPIEIAQTIYDTVHFMVDGYQITNSIGITTTQKSGREWELLFRQADQSLYTSKANGRNQYHIYTNESTHTLDGVIDDARGEEYRLDSSGLIHSLVNGYSMVYHLDLEKMAICKLSKIANGKYGWSDAIEYIPFVSQMLELVENKKKLRFSEFINPNTLSGRLNSLSTLTYSFKGKDNKNYNLKYFAGDMNQRGRIINALMILEEKDSPVEKNDDNFEKITRIEKCLASCLSNTYNAIWIVHPSTLARELVSIQTEYSRHRRINRLFEGGNFWEETQGYIQLYVNDEKEKNTLLHDLHPDRLIPKVLEEGNCIYYFHRTVDGITYYCEYTFTTAQLGDEKVIMQLYRRLEQV